MGGATRTTSRRDEVRVFAFSVITLMLAMMWFGTLPPTITRIEPNQLALLASPFGALFPQAFLLMVLVTAFAWVTGTRLFQQRWPWPLGPRVKGSSPSRSHRFANVLACTAGIWGPKVVSLPNASGLYEVPGAPPFTYFDVDVPADLAYGFVAVTSMAIAAYVLGLIIAAAVGRLLPLVKGRRVVHGERPAA